MAKYNACSRYDITLNVAHGGTDEEVANAYFDQVIAISQGTINSNFRSLFGRAEAAGSDVNKMIYVDRDEGTGKRIDATLDPPSIIINGMTSNATEVFYQLRIKNGTVTFASGRKLPVDGWVFTVKTDLKEVTITPTAGDTEALKARKRKWAEDLERFSGFVPGEYRAQRVFAALATARWTDPDELQSTCGKDSTGRTITFADWRDEPENKRLADPLLSIIAAWAKDDSKGQHAMARSTLGIKFELDEATRVNRTEPTFRPVRIVTQVYPYIDQDHPRGSMSSEEGSVGNFNCLLYCENVDGIGGARPIPAQTKLIHTGNLAQPAPDGQDGIHGSFVMDHRVFLKRFLLPQLQELCLANELHVIEPRRFVTKNDDGTKGWSILPRYALGCQPGHTPTDQHRDASDSYYAFKQASDTREFVWKANSTESNRGNPYLYETNDQYGDHNIVADSKVEVSWVPGDSALSVKGTILYDYNIRWAKDKEMRSDLDGKRYKTHAEWSIKVELTSANRDSIMKPAITGLQPAAGSYVPADLKVWTTDLNQDSTVTGHTEEDIRERLQTSLGKAIGTISHNIDIYFQHRGKFIYPGHGDLVFKNPKFTTTGNIITEVHYKELSAPHEKIVFPNTQRMQLKPPTKPSPTTLHFAKLHWGSQGMWYAK